MKIKANTKLHMMKLHWLEKELEKETVKTNFPTVRARIILEICGVKSTKQFKQWMEGVN
tara:strand:- start:204 stop:380 length:177 start_codon:yes stop_codon:yes gene_type:complete